MYKYFKRLFDIVFSFIFIIVILPILILIIILQIIFNGFPILYRPYRTGYKGVPFKINKFRTMINDADKIGGGTTALNDERITKLGNILRKTKLDEIPQLFNILFGSMSFIGPRPELKQYTDEYKDKYRNILNVKPGITDYSSIEFVNLDELVGVENADEYYEKHILSEKNDLRLKYVEDMSFITDIKIFFLTIFIVLKKILKSMRKNNGKDYN